MEEINGYHVLFVLEDSFLLYKNFKIYRFYKINKKLETVCSFPIGIKKRLLSFFRLTNRLLRLTPRCCVRLSSCQFVISMVNKLWVIDIVRKSVDIINTQRVGFSTPLNICMALGKAYWGDYGANSAYNTVNIYRLNKDLQVDVVYTFAENSIRHVHNIIFDEVNGLFWIFTGDNEIQAGIYTASKDWQQVVAFKTGEQKYRAVVGFPHSNGIIYATDSVDYENFIYYIDRAGNEKKLMSINGSVIYGGLSKNKYLFSTTVESPENKGLLALLSTQIGGGIKNRQVELLAFDRQSENIECVARYEKDFWPMKLLQYGVITIPCGQEVNTSLWVIPIACKEVDGKNILIEGL